MKTPAEELSAVRADALDARLGDVGRADPLERFLDDVESLHALCEGLALQFLECAHTADSGIGT